MLLFIPVLFLGEILNQSRFYGCYGYWPVVVTVVNNIFWKLLQPWQVLTQREIILQRNIYL